MSAGGQIHHHLGPSWFPLGFLFVASSFFFFNLWTFYLFIVYLFFDHTAEFFEQHAES